MTCQQELRKQGKAYPRTCQECGLGPCKFQPQKVAHRHAEIAKKWIDGASIQYQSPTTDEWLDVPLITKLSEGDNYLEPNPIHPDYDYYDNWRVKP